MLDAAGMIGCQYIWLITVKRGLFSHGLCAHGMVHAEGASGEQPKDNTNIDRTSGYSTGAIMRRPAVRAAELSDVHMASVLHTALTHRD